MSPSSLLPLRAYRSTATVSDPSRVTMYEVPATWALRAGAAVAANKMSAADASFADILATLLQVVDKPDSPARLSRRKQHSVYPLPAKCNGQTVAGTSNLSESGEFRADKESTSSAA